jgi:hypothetical protein
VLHNQSSRLLVYSSLFGEWRQFDAPGFELRGLAAAAYERNGLFSMKRLV